MNLDAKELRMAAIACRLRAETAEENGDAIARHWARIEEKLESQRLALLKKELARLERASAKAAAARAALPAGSSRARVTTANAKWARLAEARDRVAAQLRELE